MGMKKNIMPDENILFDKYYNNTCLIVVLTILISINKILKYLLFINTLKQCFSNYLMRRTGRFCFQCARDRQAKQAGSLLLFLSFLENISVPADDGTRTTL